MPLPIWAMMSYRLRYRTKCPRMQLSKLPIHRDPGLISKYKTNTTYVIGTYQLNYLKDIPSIKSNFNLTGAILICQHGDYTV